MWVYLYTAIALLLVLEGILPFLSPTTYRNLMRKLGRLSDVTLRAGGLCSMLVGVLIMYLLHSGLLT